MIKFINNLSITWKFFIAFAMVAVSAGILLVYDLYTDKEFNKVENSIGHIRQIDRFVNQSIFQFNQECLLLNKMVNAVSLNELESIHIRHSKNSDILQNIFKQFNSEFNVLKRSDNKIISLDSLNSYYGFFQNFYLSQAKITMEEIYVLKSAILNPKTSVNTTDTILENEGDLKNRYDKIALLSENFLARVDSVNGSLKIAGEITSGMMELNLLNTTQTSNNLSIFIIVITIIIILLEIIFAWFIRYNIAAPVRKISRNINELSNGRIYEKATVKSDDEIGKIIAASNALVEKIKFYRDFATEIGKGNFAYEMKDTDEHDELSIALNSMRLSLLKAKDEEEKRKHEEEKTTWATTGYAKFAEILRRNNNDMNALSFEIISNLVEYTGMNQGGLFILNDENKAEMFLEMKACYAYDRRKFIEKSIKIGEGLVGTCFIEKSSIYLTNIPDDYIKITSGLGEVNPGCVLIVPLKLNEEVHGVIELASFNTLEKYQIDFIEKVAESMASTISSVKINLRTAMLLEQSQLQAEKMRAQEEEMRQNLEELHTTQEEMSRKENEMRQNLEELNITQEEMLRKKHEMSSHLECVNRTILELEYDFSGIIIHVNDLFCNLLGYSREELVGKHHSVIFDNKNIHSSKKYQDFWKNLRNGIPWEGSMKRLSKSNKEIYVHGVASPVFDPSGNPQKVLEYGVDVTEQKILQITAMNEAKELQQQTEMLKAQEEIMRQSLEELNITQEELLLNKHEMMSHLECINLTILELEYDFNGIITHVNELFCKLLGYQENELIGKHHSIIFDNKNIQNSKGYQDFWKKIKEGIPWEGTMKRLTKNNKEVFVHGVASAVFDSGGNPLKVLEYGINITEQKKLQIEASNKAAELQLQTEELKAQEEELRQNLEELNATQEEMSRKDHEMSSHLECLNRTVLELEYDFNGNILHVNDLFCRLLGYSKKELIGKHHSIIFDNKNIQNSKGYQDFWKNLYKGKPWEGTMKRLTKNNREVFVHGVASPVFDEDNKPLKVLEYGVDITEQKELQLIASKKAEELQQQTEELKAQEEELRQNLEELSAIQEEMSRKDYEIRSHLECLNRTVLELEYDFNGDIIHVNDLFCKLLGYTQKELIGQHHNIIFDNKNIQGSKGYQDFWKKIKNGIPWEGTMKRLTKNNKEIFVRGVASPVFDSKGNPLKVLEYGIDITELIIMQEQALKNQKDSKTSKK